MAHKFYCMLYPVLLNLWIEHRKIASSCDESIYDVIFWDCYITPAAETWRRVWGDGKNFRGPTFLNDGFLEK